MKLLFNLDVIEGNRVKARPSDYLKSLPVSEQITAVTEFLHWAEAEQRDSKEPRGTRGSRYWCRNRDRIP